MIEAVIFDMDGLLIDSEPFWRKSEIEIFSKQEIVISEQDCRNTTGMRVDEVVRHWANQFPDAKLNKETTEKAIIAQVTAMIRQYGEAMPGVYRLIDFFKNQNISIAIASASSFALINSVVERLRLTNKFDIIQSAEFMKYGKPHPEVFLETALKLNIKPERCLVFEDSVYGVIAAKAARMKVVAVPDTENFNRIGYCIADLKLKTLEDFTPEVWQTLQ